MAQTLKDSVPCGSFPSLVFTQQAYRYLLSLRRVSSNVPFSLHIADCASHPTPAFTAAHKHISTRFSKCRNTRLHTIESPVKLSAAFTRESLAHKVFFMAGPATGADWEFGRHSFKSSWPPSRSYGWLHIYTYNLPQYRWS